MSLDNRIEFLEKSILLLLMHPSLYERLQADVCEQIDKYNMPVGRILPLLMEDKEIFTGLDNVDETDLNQLIDALLHKIGHWKSHRNFDG